MRKITRKNLDELAKVMPALSEQVQKSFVGGGSGSQSNPYTEAEYDSMLASGMWNGGFVENWGYVSSYGDVVVTGSYNGGSYNVNNAINHLTLNANGSSTGYCARYVRQALEAGGMSTDGRPGSACDYDTWLQSQGFRVVHVTGTYTPEAGDIVVFEALSGHPHGHIAMYNGQQWISDFVQRDMYGGSAYRNNPNTEYTILRRN
ncbi:hypothetical protein IX307_001058 [Bacteroides pyogenes]|uniref:CHAP domain-containing protein n=1 Tax=Bacteroides pyogenes TaxID=310300 RepID=A0A5D3FBN8_9BACE|nr:CHAP domain-containing protein [Bacteroides pyogenes]MBR8719832.1 hypothetical protein [Bacteroides pyogenes]MBR8726299.1 hypothetical protein [Bacteroides pyogenes]MBR8739933.1 hypothetical protein [Bacteroides pyogenes]MBR8755459.1 hypothetical protein [Bacteroides pyogenes]MBR8786744.1 hypothetical protein [Bacteroides pyogenes]